MPPLSNPASITSEVEDYEKANCGSTIYKSNSYHHTSSMILVIDRTRALSETNRTELFGHSLPETTELNRTEL